MSYVADKQTNRQTNKQADSNVLPTPTWIIHTKKHETLIRSHDLSKVVIFVTFENYFSYWKRLPC